MAMPGFVLLVHDRGDGDPAKRLGITVTKKIGGAVVRNRMKRRFRALAQELLPEQGKAGADHILIGRAGGVERDFGKLREEMGKALRKIGGGDACTSKQSDRSFKTVRAEPVEADHFEEKKCPSTSSGRTDERNRGQ
jgi:ribonuclease P protein component